MNEDFIILFTVLPLAFSFMPLAEKVFPGLRLSKAASAISFLASIILLALYTGEISGGKEYFTVVGGWNSMLGIHQRLDSLSWAALAIMYSVSFPSLLYSFSQGGFGSTFYFFFLVLHAGMAGMVLADDIFNLFVFLEITGICSYILIAYTKKERAVFAGFKYLMLSSLGISLFLAGVYVVYSITGSLSYTDMQAAFPSTASFAASFAAAALIAGIGVRTAFIPYTWLPDAHAFAPHPVSAVLSGVVIKVSFLAVWKIIVLLGLYEARLFLLWMGSAIALIGVIRALAQSDYKVLLAWHSVSQMGYIFAGFGAGTTMSVTGSLYHAASHAFFKSLLFLSVSTVIIFSGERSLKKVTGTGKYLPLAALFFAVGAMSIAGIPPFTGYVSKKLIFSGLKGYPAAYWMLFASSVGTVASFTKLSLIFRGRESAALRDGIVKIKKHRFISGYLGMALLAAICLAAGLFGNYLTGFASSLIYGPGSAALTDPALWNDTGEYIKTAVTVVSGILLYLIITGKAGKKILETAGRIKVPFDSQLALLLFGFLAIAAFLYLF